MAAQVYLLAGIAVLLLLFVLTVLALLYYSGVLEIVEVGAGKPPISKAVVAYKYRRGPYKDCSDLFNEVSRLAPQYKCVGIYYDDPKEVPQERLRYAVGSILSEGDSPADAAVRNKMIEEGFKLITLPAVTNVVKTTFPYKSVLSILIAIKKVYPKMEEYVKAHRLCAYPFLEIYESDVIHFMAPLARQDEFFVDECKGDNSYVEQSPSFQEPSFDESASFSEASLSTSRLLDVTGENDAHTDDEMDIQDQKVTSSVDVGPDTSSGELDTSMHSSKECSGVTHDSGIGSGLATPLCADLSGTSAANAEGSENGSQSSFEEIQMDESLMKS